MKYDITKPQPPTMPDLGKGTECIKLLLSQTSKDMHAPLVPMFLPILGAHMCGTEFQYPDLTWKEPAGMMANLVAESGGNKGQLSNLVEALCRDFRTPKQISQMLRNIYNRQRTGALRLERLRRSLFTIDPFQHEKAQWAFVTEARRLPSRRN